MAAVEQVAQQGLACITHMSIEVTYAVHLTVTRNYEYYQP